MANGEDWEDISDGGDDDWEMGKPIAPRSGSGSGSFRTGSNGSSAAPKSHHRPQSSWGDDDWGGDEESWRPGPANPSLMHASGTRATPPRSPALTKGVSPARPAMGSRRWTRSRAACKRLGVLVCLVAAVVTLSSFGILKGGGSGGGPVDARGWRPSDASDAFERTARSFEERPSADPGPARQWDSSNSFVPASSGASRERFGFREEKAPATRDAPASDRETPVVQEAQVATIGASETVSVSQRVADEIQRLRASHEHVSNAFGHRSEQQFVPSHFRRRAVSQAPKRVQSGVEALLIVGLVSLLLAKIATSSTAVGHARESLHRPSPEPSRAPI